MDSLSELSVHKISEAFDKNRIHPSTFQELPGGLLKLIGPHLSAVGLSKVHRTYQEKGFDVQQYWLELYQRSFPRDTSIMGCLCHDQSVDWRQRFLLKACKQRLQELERCHQPGPKEQEVQQQKILKILENPLSSPQDDHRPLDEFCQSFLHIESRLLPAIQASEGVLQILQRHLRELVLSHYRPQYGLPLRYVLERLIHRGRLRKLTLKQPTNLDPAKLTSILEVCAGRSCHYNKRCSTFLDPRLPRKRPIGQPSCQETRPMKAERKDPPVNQDPCVDRETNESRKTCLTEECSNALIVSKHLGTCTEACGEIQRERTKSLHRNHQPAGHSEVGVDEEEQGSSLYDQCFAPICDAEDVGPPLYIRQGAPPLSPIADEDICGNASDDQCTWTCSSSTPSTEARDEDCASPCSLPRAHCGRHLDHCIHHLVLCGFPLEIFNYSDMLCRVLADWPGLHELDFIDNLMFPESCRKVLGALLEAQKHTRSLCRLRIEDSHVGAENLELVSDLVSRSTNLKKLELLSAELRFPPQLEVNTFHCLGVLKLGGNDLGDVSYLQRALMHPACAIRHLDVNHCSLGTQQLDSLFASAAGNNSLRELIVSHNVYRTGSGTLYDNRGNLLQPLDLVGLLQASQITKLDMSGCQFTLRGWNNAQQFVEALQQNCDLRQLLWNDNNLTNECLLLLVEAFICPKKEADTQMPRLCLQISYNERLTAEGLGAFRQSLQAASTAPGSSIRLPLHILTTIDPRQHACSTTMEDSRLAEVLNVTVNNMDKSVWLKSTGARHTPSYAENRSEHVYIM